MEITNMKKFTMIERKPSEREWQKPTVREERFVSFTTDEARRPNKRKVKHNAHDRATLSLLNSILHY